MPALLSIKGMTHFFGGLKAVSNFSYDIPEGFLRLIGPNGSGKTTIFNLITGIYSPPRARYSSTRISPAPSPIRLSSQGSLGPSRTCAYSPASQPWI